LTRVLFLAESFHPVLGGGERHIRRLSAALAASGQSTLVLTRRGDAGWPADEMLDGVRVLRVGPSGSGPTGKYTMVPAVLAKLRALRDAFDVLVVRGTRVLGLPGLVAARALGKRVVLQCEVSGEMSGAIYTWGTALESYPPATAAVALGVRARNLLFRDADAFVTISARTRDEFVAAGLPQERVRLIPHGIDVAAFRPADADEKRELRAALGLPALPRLVTFTGRLLRGKGVEVLVEAFARLATRRNDAHLVIVGSGAGQVLSIEDALRAQVEREGLSARVTFTGRVDNVADYLRASDVYVFPSFFEAMPLSLLEAASCGLPCVATRIGGVVDAIEDGRSGILVEPGDVSGLSAALGAVLDLPERGASLGAAARGRVLELFDEREKVLRYRELFEEIAG
jgi:glycosyltransferase involved in cell wall biosynthesis